MKEVTKDHVTIQEEGRHLQAKERSLRRNETWVHLDIGLLASKTEQINFCYLSNPVCGTVL